MAGYSEAEVQAARSLEVAARARLDDIKGRLATATGSEANALCRQAHQSYRDLGAAHFVLSDGELPGGRS